jgi:hypothetical protein
MYGPYRQVINAGVSSYDTEQEVVFFRNRTNGMSADQTRIRAHKSMRALPSISSTSSSDPAG